MSQILKTIEARNEVQQILYTNIRIQESDNLEIRRQKRALKRSVSRYLNSKRRCIEALIQNNFTSEDWYCTLTFTEERLPPEKVKADSRFAYFIKMLRRCGGRNIRYLKVLEHRHGDGPLSLSRGAVRGRADGGADPPRLGKRLRICPCLPASAVGYARPGPVPRKGGAGPG